MRRNRKKKKSTPAAPPATAEPVRQVTHDDFPLNAIIKMKKEISRYRVVAHSDNGVYLSRSFAGLLHGDVRYMTLAELAPVEEITVPL